VYHKLQEPSSATEVRGPVFYYLRQTRTVVCTSDLCVITTVEGVKGTRCLISSQHATALTPRHQEAANTGWHNPTAGGSWGVSPALRATMPGWCRARRHVAGVMLVLVLLGTGAAGCSATTLTVPLCSRMQAAMNAVVFVQIRCNVGPSVCCACPLLPQTLEGSFLHHCRASCLIVYISTHLNLTYGA
jgi:hypothetical protein